MVGASAAVDGRGLLIALRRVCSVVVFGVLPVIAVVLLMGWTLSGSTFVSDFHGDLYDAGRAILAGHDPYRARLLDRLAAAARAGRFGLGSPTFAVPVYPAPALVASAPLALLPFRAAGIVFTVVSALAMVAGLRLLGVRDLRCYGAAFLSWPLLHSLRLGQVNELLVLGCALAWRLRERPGWGGGLALAVTIVLKVLLWPLAVFGALCGRWRLSISTAVWVVALLLAGWAALGFAGLTGYPHLLDDLSGIEGASGVSLVAAARALGLPALAGRLAELLVTLGLIGLAVAVAPGRWAGGQRGTDPIGAGAGAVVRDREARAFGLLVLAGLTSSSVVWPHYLVLLYVPIALLAPSLSPLWLVPLLCDLAPVEQTHGNLWQIAVYLVVELVVALALSRPLLVARGSRAAATPAESDRAGSGSIPHPLDCRMASDRPRLAHVSRRSGRLNGSSAPTKLGGRPQPRQQSTDHP